MQLPAPLRDRIEALLDGVAAQDLAASYAALSDRYRRLSGASLQIRDAHEALAYTASRLPATYGACRSVYARLQEVWPGFQPRSLLDLGAGPGTATLAALDAWEEFDDMIQLEPNPHLRSLAAVLCGDRVRQEAKDLARRGACSADLVTLSYVLNELPAAEQDAALDAAWRDAAQALVLVEPGTPLGFEVILRARARLQKLGAHIAAPCPQSGFCPVQGTERWCHFSVRIDRPGFHRRIKPDAVLGYEDEKFSYLAVTRQPVPRPDLRVIGHPRGSKLVDLELCRAQGDAVTLRLSKRDPLYKAARKAEWGDGLSYGAISAGGITDTASD